MSRGPFRNRSIVPAALAIALIAVGAAPVSNSDECACAASQMRNGWCSACEVGWVAAVRIESRRLFDAIDAHGHKVDPTTFHCASCQKAIAGDGFCGACKVGFVEKEAYFSRLTWALGRGTVLTDDDIECGKCAAHLSSAGWCDKCKRGLVGHFAYKDKKLFRIAARGRAVLIQAIAKVSDCEDCAIALAIDRWCPKCRVSYEDGKLVKGAKSDE